jgi:hypothetical protein
VRARFSTKVEWRAGVRVITVVARRFGEGEAMFYTPVSRVRPLLWASGAAALLGSIAPATSVAQTASAQDHEARIQQLEKELAELRRQLRSSAPAAATTAGPPPQPIQDTTITPAANPGTRFSYGGFIKLDALFTDTTAGEIPDGSVGRLFYVPSAIPVGGANEGTDLDAHVQFSRFWFATDTALGSGDKLKSYIELDLFGGGSNAFLGNETATNTYGVTLRHAYVSWNSWLAGQTWSNFQDVAALPDAVDFIGPTEGTIFVRQAQLRYTRGPWSFSAENPETTVATLLGSGPRINSDDNSVPDVTARWITKGNWGHFTVAALVRQFKYQDRATRIDDSTTGAALSVSGKWNLGASDDLRYMASGGSGIGRYLGLAIGSDTVIDTSGSLDAIDGWGGFVAWRHAFNAKWRGNVFYSVAQFDNDTALTGLAVTRRVQSTHVNLICSPLPKLDIGAELSWAERSLESGANGELRRLHMHVKYNF